MLRFVIDGPLAAAPAHHWRIDANIAVAGAGPIGNPAPADAVFHLHIEPVATATGVEVMARVGVIAPPGIFEPVGHLYGLGIGIDPVRKHDRVAINHPCRRNRIFGVPNAHCAGIGANAKIVDITFVQRDAVDDRTAGASCVDVGRTGRYYVLFNIRRPGCGRRLFFAVGKRSRAASQQTDDHQKENGDGVLANHSCSFRLLLR